MKTDHRTTFELPLILLLAVSACGGGTPPPVTPTEAPQAEADAAPSGASLAATGSSPDPAAPDTAADGGTAAPASQGTNSQHELEKPTRPVRSILEATDTVFFLSYEESDPGVAAEATCAKESGGDPQKKNACMAKARQAMEGKGYRFKRTPKDEATCTMLRRQGNTLSTQHKFRYKFGEETENSAVIKMDGPDQGPVKWEKIPSEFKVEVPNDYMIVMQDPKFGRLVYYAKVGIPGD